MFPKKLTYQSILLLAGITIMMASCVDQITYDLPPEDRNDLAIQGRLVKGDPHHIKVEVKRVFGFQSGSTFLWADSVQMSNDLGQTIEVENAIHIGVYESWIPVDDPNFEIQDGGAFKIKVWLPDGRIFESDFDQLQPVVKIDSVTTQFIESETPSTNGIESKASVQFLLNTPLKIQGEEERSRINWMIQHTFKITDAPIMTGVPSKVCYVSELLNVEEIEPVDGNILNSDYLDNHELYKTDISFKFQEGFYLNVYQQSLSEGAAEYFRQIHKLTSRTGNMFEGPVGSLVSNFKNITDPEEKVFGYFYATAVDSFHVATNPYEIYVPIPGRYCPSPLPPPPGGGCAVEVCCDCLDAPVSTMEKPDYWE